MFIWINSFTFSFIHFIISKKKLFNVSQKRLCILFSLFDRYICIYNKQKKLYIWYEKHSGVTDYMRQAISISIYVCTKAILFTPCYLYIQKNVRMWLPSMNLFQIWGRNKDSNEKKIVIVNCVCVCIRFFLQKKVTD